MDSIFGIGIFEFIFILIFALIFLGPERLPKVTKDVLDFIRRLQRLSGDLTRQVNEEIGDLRELDPRYHMDQMMNDEEDEQEKKPAPPSPPSTVQTSAPSQPQPAKATGTTGAGQDPPTATETILPPQAAVPSTNLSTSANGRQNSAARTQTDAGPSPAKSRPTPTATRSANKPQKRGVKSLAELRKQQRAKRQSTTSGPNSSYLAERNKRAQGRAQTRRDVMAAQKIEQGSVAPGDGSTLIDERSSPEPAEPKAVISAGQAGDDSEETKA